KADDKDGHLGFIAEDVPDMLATYDRKSLDPMDIVAVLTKVVQEQQKISEQSEKVLLQQQKTISELSGKVADLEKALKLKNSLASAEIYLH
ncbi:MAG: hypothetical protein Q7U10_00350, partial [Thermodesulfovibrionia bacterium]|nr:hypothetical protein [Thermodesulfovibrionia bacterium]